VYFKFNVIQGSQTAVPIFTETHYVPTDDLGQVNLVIGQGTANTGVFSELDWSLGSYYLGIELDTGNGYLAMGTTQLLSVPYALYAENSGNSTPTTPNLEAVLAENNSANNQQIKDLQDPTDAQDATTKAYIDALIANLQTQIDDLDTNNSSGSVTDQDGNTYDYLTYGDQVWTVENAEMVTYRDGTEIPQVTDPTQWSNLTTGAWCYYDNDPTKPRLYNWYAVAGIHDTDPNTPNKEFAPDGWHVPSDAEWTTLEEYLIANDYNYDGTTTGNKIAKAMASTTGWISSTETGAPGNDQSLNNDSGFNAFSEGFRSYNGSFGSEGNNAVFWSSTEYITDSAWNRDLFNYDSNLFRYNVNKRMGFSVRFVKDGELDPNDMDNDNDGYTGNQGDCDDYDAQVNPGATEIEDGIDNDCDGQIDEGFSNLPNNLGLVGSAVNNWGISGPDTPLIYLGNGQYETYVTFIDGELRFRENNVWDNSWGDTGADGTLDQAWDNIAVVAGVYLVTVNWFDLTYTLQPIDTTLTDGENNSYTTLPYGTQIWSTTNAEMVTYRDGTTIPQVTDATEWDNLITGAWAYYNNDPTKHRLYNWYAVAGIHDTDPNTPNKVFAPEGWHVPTDAEWTTLEEYLIASGYNYDGTTTENKIGKAMASNTGWNSSTNTGAIGNDQSLNNSSDFNAFPEGGRLLYESFDYEGSGAVFWSSTENDSNENDSNFAWNRYLYDYDSNLYRGSPNKQNGWSVRFVRD
jgi:uncharacterized protein (TIGR02145 family)